MDIVRLLEAPSQIIIDSKPYSKPYLKFIYQWKLFVFALLRYKSINENLISHDGTIHNENYNVKFRYFDSSNYQSMAVHKLF